MIRLMSQAVIFDIDGVLIDSYQAHFQSWAALGAEHGIEITYDAFAESFGRTSRDIISLWWGQGLDDAKVTAMDDRKEALFRQLIEAEFPAMSGALKLIDALAEAGFALAVGSSGPPENVDLVMRKLDRQSLFGARVTGMDVTHGKPDPEVFQIAAQKLNVDPNSCAVIEDAPAGVQAANAAQMTSIALTGTASRDLLADANLIVDSLAELSPGMISDLIG
jgi:beta-phosphoglucomutase